MLLYVYIYTYIYLSLSDLNTTYSWSLTSLQIHCVSVCVHVYTIYTWNVRSTRHLVLTSGLHSTRRTTEKTRGTNWALNYTFQLAFQYQLSLCEISTARVVSSVTLSGKVCWWLMELSEGNDSIAVSCWCAYSNTFVNAISLGSSMLL